MSPTVDDQGQESLARHPFTVAFGHYFYAWFHKLCREDEVVEQATGVTIKICDEQGFPFWRFASTALLGSAVIEGGKAGVEMMRQAVTSYLGIGGQLYSPELHGLLSTGLAQVVASKRPCTPWRTNGRAKPGSRCRPV